MPKVETSFRAIIDRLMAEGWVSEGGTKHEKFAHAASLASRSWCRATASCRRVSPAISPRLLAGSEEGAMARYIALIDGEAGAYGVAFPDCPAAPPWVRPWTRL